MINTIIFSKDRACQLDALLRSMRRYAPALKPVVLYSASNESFERGYSKIEGVRMVLEKDFRKDLLKLLSLSAKFTMFLCDDDVFVRDIPRRIDLHHNDACLSLRLSDGLTYCYPRQSAQTPPKIKNNRFLWSGANGDYGYPMSVDGHIFRTMDIIYRAATYNFWCPNTFESMLAQVPIGLPVVQCVERPVVVNVPLNQVQVQWGLPNMGVDVRMLNATFLEGKRLNYEYDGNISCHAELSVNFS